MGNIIDIKLSTQKIDLLYDTLSALFTFLFGKLQLINNIGINDQ